MIPTATRMFPAMRPRGAVRAASGTPGREPLVAAIVIVGSVAVALAYVWVWCPLQLAPDEAHYWDWSRNLDWSYYSKGPLVAWLIRASCELFGPLSVRLTGDLAAAVRTPAALCHGATLAGWYVLAAGVFRSPRLGVAVVALAAALPVVRVGSVLMTIDPPFLACWTWALISIWKALEQGRLRWWAAAGALTAIGTLAKFTMLLFPVAVAGFLLFHRRYEFHRAGVWIFGAISLSGWLPIVVWNAQHDWVSFRHVVAQAGASDGHSRFQWLGPPTFVVGQLGMMFGLWLGAFLAAAWRFRPARESDSGISLLWWCTAPVWVFFFALSFAKSGQPNWPAPAYVGGFVLAVAWVREQLAGRYSRALSCVGGATVAAGVLVCVAIHFPATVRPALAWLAGPPTEKQPVPVRKLDVTARLSGWKTLAAEVDDIRARVKVQTGREPVVSGNYWTLPGQLRFYCAGRPDTYSVGIPNHSDRHSHYDYCRPNPVADAQEFRGRSFVVVGTLDVGMMSAFETAEFPVVVTHAENGIAIESWVIWVCHGFRGFAESGRRPGY